MKTTGRRLVRVAAVIVAATVMALVVGFAMFAYSVSRPVLG
jgi:hypothetical protein